MFTLVTGDLGIVGRWRARGLTQGVLTSPRNGTFPCLNCQQCSNVLKGDSFTHPQSGKRFPIKGQFNCNSSFVVYLIKCPCGLGYVGETTQHIRDRISKHKSTIRCGRTLLPIPAHFLQNNHNVAQLRFQVIDHVRFLRRGGDRIKRLKERESFWIYTLQTLAPHGLNREYEGHGPGHCCLYFPFKNRPGTEYPHGPSGCSTLLSSHIVNEWSDSTPEPKEKSVLGQSL
ncbi:unnamed protein product [Ranitomeya imitator]|uniref:GIY-YIG domain-containing protein n=1 Tax=Ranitomeya imitator TaxID=111125 RepID=A0ABN9KQ58_9NEOB|nr:unnamed protein product [Ranitomeya imitator]